MINVIKQDLEFAMETVSADRFEMSAYVCTVTGKVWVVGFEDDLCELDSPPVDLHENDQYIMVPTKVDLDLGRRLAIKFTESFIPEELENVYAYFRRAGAYGKFKVLLNFKGLLDNWYQFETEHVDRGLIDWCEINGLRLCDDQ